MLTELFVNDGLKERLSGLAAFDPFSAASRRAFWEGLPEALKDSLIKRAEPYLGWDWPVLPAVRYMDFHRNGNRSRYEFLYFERRRGALGSLTIAEAVEGKGRFVDDIINGIWCICEESSWCLPAHNKFKEYQEPLPDVTRPYIDLFAAETGAYLSWVYYLLKSRLDRESPVICRRIVHEIRRRILIPFLEREDFWWMGFERPPGSHVNNWNPWILSNCLTAFITMEEDRDTQVRAVAKILKSLDFFIDAYHEDGGCDEGTSYWNVAGGSLFDCLELLYLVSEGKLDVYDQSLIRNIGSFIYRSHISEKYYINFADGGAKVDISSELVYRYGCRTGDDALKRQGISAFHLALENGQKRACLPLFRELSYIRNFEKLLNSPAEPPYADGIWMDGIQVMAERARAGTNRGLYLAAKGGHNSESHNHNDVGQFIVYSDGKPAIIDAGVETYTAKTFGPQRYEIWTMQSAYHNLPTVNGIQQGAGRQYCAGNVEYVRDGLHTGLTMDIAAAYPEEAGIQSWKRQYTFCREGAGRIEITDDFSLEKASEITLSIMTPCAHVLEQEGLIRLTLAGGKDIHLRYDGNSLAYTSERIELEDERLAGVWGGHLYRIRLEGKHRTDAGVWTMKITQAD